jgi:hypothetical protein
MSDQNGYAERQSEWVKNAGIEIGDSVLIIRRIDSHGTNAEWVDDMDETIGTVGKITRIQDIGVQVRCPHHPRPDAEHYGWWYPFFVLVKVEDNE